MPSEIYLFHPKTGKGQTVRRCTHPGLGNGKEAIVRFAEQHHIPLLRMEDGFIRSVGLGSNLVPPLSLVTDDMSIYFNAETPSRLEYILQNQNFDDQDFQTALKLQKC